MHGLFHSVSNFYFCHHTRSYLMTLSEKEISPSHSREVFSIGTGLGLGALLAACGGGGGGSDSDDSRNLRAALDRLKIGMNEDEIIAAVGWPPNDGYLTWDSGDEWLTVNAYAVPNSGRSPVITSAGYTKGSVTIQRSYIV
jgi:hypothetical protein